jgi:hypothetical protein
MLVGNAKCLDIPWVESSGLQYYCKYLYRPVGKENSSELF